MDFLGQENQGKQLRGGNSLTWVLKNEKNFLGRVVWAGHSRQRKEPVLRPTWEKAWQHLKKCTQGWMKQEQGPGPDYIRLRGPDKTFAETSYRLQQGPSARCAVAVA